MTSGAAGMQANMDPHGSKKVPIFVVSVLLFVASAGSSTPVEGDVPLNAAASFFDNENCEGRSAVYSVADGECVSVADLENANATVPKSLENGDNYFTIVYDCTSGALSAGTGILYGCNDDDECGNDTCEIRDDSLPRTGHCVDGFEHVCPLATRVDTAQIQRHAQVARYESIDDCNSDDDREGSLEPAETCYQKEEDEKTGANAHLNSTFILYDCDRPYPNFQQQFHCRDNNCSEDCRADVVLPPKVANQGDDETLQAVTGCKGSLPSVFLKCESMPPHVSGGYAQKYPNDSCSGAIQRGEEPEIIVNVTREGPVCELMPDGSGRSYELHYDCDNPTQSHAAVFDDDNCSQNGKPAHWVVAGLGECDPSGWVHTCIPPRNQTPASGSGADGDSDSSRPIGVRASITGGMLLLFAAAML